MNIKVKGGKIHKTKSKYLNLGYTLCGIVFFFRNGKSQYGDEKTEESATCKHCIRLNKE